MAMIDAMVDAMPDARDPTVHVHVSSPAPVGSWDVVFYSPSNELIARVTATEDVPASAAMPDGGSVIIMPDPVNDDPDGMRAVFGVKPGDEIRLDPIPPPRGSTTATLTVPPHDGTASYVAVTRCDGGSSRTTTMTAFFDIGCPTPLALPILVEAQDANRGTLGAFRTVLPSLESANLTGTYLAPEMLSVQFTNGDSPSGLIVSVNPVLDHALLPGVNQDRFQTLAAREVASFSMMVEPAAVIDAHAFTLFFGSQQHQRVRPASESAFAFDARTEGLPSYTNLRYDRVQRKLSIGPPIDPTIDGQIVAFVFERDPFLNVHWTLVLPPGASEIAMPPIPDPRYDPGDQPDVMMIRVTATAIRASSFNGYDDLRRGATATMTDIGSYYDVTGI